MKYVLIEARESFRRYGQYLNKLHSLLSQFDTPMTEDDWREAIGADKFAEAVEYGLIAPLSITEEEALEREGEVITEISDGPMLDKVLSYDANNAGDQWIESWVAAIKYGDKNCKLRIGRLRVGQSIKKETLTTDDLDMWDEAACGALDELVDKIVAKDDKVFGTDTGDLRYDLRSRCPA